MLEFSYDFNAMPDSIQVKLNGSIRSDEALETFSEIIKFLSDKASNHKRIILDFSHVKLINSSGIGKMLVFNKFLQDNGCKMYILGLSPSLKQLFMFAKIENSVPLISTLSDIK